MWKMTSIIVFCFEKIILNVRRMYNVGNNVSLRRVVKHNSFLMTTFTATHIHLYIKNYNNIVYNAIYYIPINVFYTVRPDCY